jgi:hypothetical protein
MPQPVRVRRDKVDTQDAILAKNGTNDRDSDFITQEK